AGHQRRSHRRVEPQRSASQQLTQAAPPRPVRAPRHEVLGPKAARAALRGRQPRRGRETASREGKERAQASDPPPANPRGPRSPISAPPSPSPERPSRATSASVLPPATGVRASPARG